MQKTRKRHGEIHRRQHIHATDAENTVRDPQPQWRTIPTISSAPEAKLFEVADPMPLAEMAPAREDKVRAFVRKTINTVLTNSRPN